MLANVAMESHENERPYLCQGFGILMAVEINSVAFDDIPPFG